MALLASVSWVPGNLSIFELWFPESINFGEKALNSTVFSVQGKLEIRVGFSEPSNSIKEPFNLNSQRRHWRMPSEPQTGLTLSDPAGFLFAIPLSILIATVFWMDISISKPDGFSS